MYVSDKKENKNFMKGLKINIDDSGFKFYVEVMNFKLVVVEKKTYCKI